MNRFITKFSKKNYRNFSTKIFKTSRLDFYNRSEKIVKNTKENFNLIEDGFRNINSIGVIGWGSQAPAQTLNLKDSLKNTYINIKVGVRENSHSISNIKKSGIKENNIGNIDNIVKDSDLILYLISDYAQVKTYKNLFKNIKPGSTLGLSHGFLIGYLEKNNIKIPDNINIIMVAPKGMGPSLRQKYLEGLGINSSIAVYQDYTGNAEDIALSWALSIGSPYIFETNIKNEYKSDIFGERGILLGGIYGISEYIYRNMNLKGKSKKQSYEMSAYNITGTINRYIKSRGIKNLYMDMDVNNKQKFASAYTNTYHLAKELLNEIYDEVKSGNEIESVIMAGDRLNKYPINDIDNNGMWLIEKNNRNHLYDQPIQADVAGIYIATMMAQIDILMENGHSISEIVNESIIEAIDSLNPYLYQKGVSHMIDNCSTTARLGARKWGPRFDYLYSQNDVLGKNIYENKGEIVKAFILMEEFTNHPIHQCFDKIKSLEN